MRMRKEPVVLPTRIGQGLFAASPYRKNQTITKISGRRVSAAEVWEAGGTFADNCFRFGPETFLDPLDGPGRFLNHSCAPNTAVVKRNHQLFLIAAEPIAKGTEILIDYSTILGADDIWTMHCKCGARRCRRKIRNIATLPDVVRDGYIARRMVPGFILDTL